MKRLESPSQRLKDSISSAVFENPRLVYTGAEQQDSPFLHMSYCLNS